MHGFPSGSALRGYELSERLRLLIDGASVVMFWSTCHKPQSCCAAAV